MSRSIQHWPHEVVHCRIYDDKRFAATFFHIEHARQQHSRRTNDRAPWFEQKMRMQGFENLRDHARIYFPRRRLLFRISHTKAAAKIEIPQQNSVTA